MTRHIDIGGLRVAPALATVVRDRIAPGTGIEPAQVWQLLEQIVQDLGPRHRALLDTRDRMQAQIDAWWLERRGRPLDIDESRRFLESIGYLVPEGPAFAVTTTGVDDEIGRVAGPQLVVPVDNARYALNAANARWGSLYDALYGTDVIPETPGAERGRDYNPARGEAVIRRANALLDEIAPLVGARWDGVLELTVQDGALRARLGDRTTDLAERTTGLAADRTTGLAADRATGLAERTTSLAPSPAAFAGFRMKHDGTLAGVLLRRHGLHVDLDIDRAHPIGLQHGAGLKDIVVETAISTIIDCEDSVAAVDADDKARVYANWCGLMQGTLTATVPKGGRSFERRLNPDRSYLDPAGQTFTLPGRSLLLVRHVGAHLWTDAVTTADGAPIPETFLDCVITTLAALHDLHDGRDAMRNSRTGSLYIVKPKQHGPEEVALSVELFERVERAFSLPPRTLKIGIMDEERRTTLNLMECLRAARDRVIFINTGFLDRTGDEIHTHMEAGPMLPKGEIRHARWMLAYEDWNVDIGLEAGLPGRAQIGKGMWAMPDEMNAMLATKQAHPEAGASCAWVPSPTAATLHALHYLRVDVAARQRELAGRPRARLDDLLTPPLLDRKLTSDEITAELDNNLQGILGYVVRWVDHGVGCSKVPDLRDVGLMEDRATLRISSQHIANWLHHGIVNEEQVRAAMRRMAAVVDRQNAADPAYRPMCANLDESIPFRAAESLVFDGRAEPNGYTERLLTHWRRELKSVRAAARPAPAPSADA